uniref:Uncharacterized protein n=1 Tax=Anguilla anguilla TaxID=7936 RepID=A0A0E9PAG7_ANGAN
MKAVKRLSNNFSVLAVGDIQTLQGDTNLHFI